MLCWTTNNDEGSDSSIIEADESIIVNTLFWFFYNHNIYHVLRVSVSLALFLECFLM